MRAVAIVLLGVLLALPVPSAAVADPADPIAAALDRIFVERRPAGATVAVDVREASGGRVVYQRDPELRVLPASNQKLLTSAAALEVLGAGYRFRTTVHARGGDLYLRGQGDPTLTHQRIDRLAAAVARVRTKRYARLILDDTWFDRVPLGLDWSWQDETSGSAAPVSALSFAATDRFDNAAVEIRYQGVAGHRPAIQVWPPAAGVRVVNQAATSGGDTIAAVRAHGAATSGGDTIAAVRAHGAVAGGDTIAAVRAHGAVAGGDTIAAVRAHGAGSVTVSGSVAAGRSGTILVSVPDPAATTARLFRAALGRHGVTISGRTSRAPVPGGARVMASQESPPLAEILTPLLKFSNNGIAELLVKAMSRAADPARPGNWPTGLAAATTALARLGVDTRLLTMGDGSGLSRRNWVTARQVTTVLEKAQRRTWFPAFRAALPVAGDPNPVVGGTLHNRMRDTPAAGNVRAKTGTLSGVNALSGYATAPGGRLLIFTFIVNAATTTAAPLLDEAAVALTTTPLPPALP
ncbi:D-alanyl-D-alanine carboxypeptidase/D-alanyl-D-alanine endopeptidase [Actinoplanes philippinensis]|uniref:D-alanyl-D-alanine carboxypeptidase/D-alanyl-D-alanine endopeptidase n=1 Tax=Actinoplanes philippinensis TaxID=35752 RepID=UPI0033DD10FB